MSECKHENVIKNHTLGEAYHVCKDCREEVIEDPQNGWITLDVATKRAKPEVSEKKLSEFNYTNFPKFCDQDFSNWDTDLRRIQSHSRFHDFILKRNDKKIANHIVDILLELRKTGKLEKHRDLVMTTCYAKWFKEYLQESYS